METTSPVSHEMHEFLNTRHVWMAQEDLGKELCVRQSLHRATKALALPATKPKYPLDDESLCTGLYRYIDVDQLGVSVAIPDNHLLEKEYRSLNWLFLHALHYADDSKTMVCESEDDVDGQRLRETLAIGGYAVVKQMHPYNTPYRDITFSVYEPLMKHIHPLEAEVEVQDLLGRNCRPLRLEDDEPHSKWQANAANTMRQGLKPLFEEASMSKPDDYLRYRRKTPAMLPTGSSEWTTNVPQPKPAKGWNGTVDWEHSRLSFRAFLRSSTELTSLYNLLDCKLFGLAGRPSFIDEVADDMRAMRAHPASAIPPDALEYPSWALLAHAGCFTLVHQDSAGFSTFIVGCSGVKYWFYVQWIDEKPSEAARAFRYQAASDINIMSLQYASQPPWVTYDHRVQDFTFDQNRYDSEESATWREKNPKVSEIYVIPIKPGMCVVQPSTAVHAVYNATDCVALGGHFLSYESLPLIELGRRVDHVSDPALTNDFHPSINLIMQGLCLMLKKQRRAPLPKKQLLSLARMVFYYHSYRSRVALGEGAGEVVDKTVQAQAEQILKQHLLAADLPLPDKSDY